MGEHSHQGPLAVETCTCALGAVGGRAAFDGDNVVLVGNSNWRFVHAPGVDDPLVGLYYRAPNFEKYFYLTDGRGRSLAFTDSIGNDYLGDVTYTQNGGNRAGAIDRSHTFAKSRAETADAPGLSFYRNRYYDQTTRRWTQEDPIGIAGGVNLYQYVGNNPATFTDPFGLRADTLRFESEPLRAVFSSLRGQSPAFDRQMSDMEQSTVVTNVVAGEAFGGHVTPDRIENGRVVEQTITIDPGSVAEARRMFDATGRGPLDIKDVIGHEVGHAASTARTGGRTCPDPDCSVRAENTVRRDRDRPPRTRY